MRDATLVGAVHDRVDARHGTFLALRAGTDRVILATRYILDEPSPSDVAALLDAGSRFAMVTAPFGERLGENGTEAWRAHLEDPSTQRFEESLDRISASALAGEPRSEEHTSELQSLMRISYAVFCLKKTKYYTPT